MKIDNNWNETELESPTEESNLQGIGTVAELKLAVAHGICVLGAVVKYAEIHNSGAIVQEVPYRKSREKIHAKKEPAGVALHVRPISAYLHNVI